MKVSITLHSLYSLIDVASSSQSSNGSRFTGSPDPDLQLLSESTTNLTRQQVLSRSGRHRSLLVSPIFRKNWFSLRGGKSPIYFIRLFYMTFNLYLAGQELSVTLYSNQNMRAADILLPMRNQSNSCRT